VEGADPSRKVIAYMPVYVPREIIHAAGMLPLGIMGGGDGRGDPRRRLLPELHLSHPTLDHRAGLSKRMDFVDGMLFPSICDVIRNLSGMWKLLFPGKYVRYFDVPQNYRDDVGGSYYTNELNELREGLEHLSGRKITDDALRASIAVYNENRRLVQAVYGMRSREPWKVPSSEVYLLMRAGLVLPVEEHNQMLSEYLAAAENVKASKRDNCRVVINGSFCEQPPLNLIKSIELAGCYIVDDDYMIVHRWLRNPVSTGGDPMQNPSLAFLHESIATAAKYDDKEEDKGKYLLEQVRSNAAEGVIFAAPSFCDPALLERPMLADRCSEHNVPLHLVQARGNWPDAADPRAGRHLRRLHQVVERLRSNHERSHLPRSHQRTLDGEAEER
jgi:benzoyl-CoA reductase subunit C